jgi:dihydroneopterin aldolase
MNDPSSIQRLDCLDQIRIPNLRCSAIIGCKPEERLLPQALLLTITVFLDTRKAAASDDLNLTVHYSHLSKDIIGFVSRSTCQLLETLANQLADHCLEKYPIEGIRISILKPAGIATADGAVLDITRCKQEPR